MPRPADTKICTLCSEICYDGQRGSRGWAIGLLLLQPLRLEGLELAVFLHLRHASLVLLELRPQGSQLFSPCLAHLLVGTEKRRSEQRNEGKKVKCKKKKWSCPLDARLGMARRSNARARRTLTCSQRTDCCSSRSHANHFNRTNHVLKITKIHRHDFSASYCALCLPPLGGLSQPSDHRRRRLSPPLQPSKPMLLSPQHPRTTSPPPKRTYLETIEIGQFPSALSFLLRRPCRLVHTGVSTGVVISAPLSLVRNRYETVVVFGVLPQRLPFCSFGGLFLLEPLHG